MSNGSISNANWERSIEQGAILVYSGNVGHFVRDVKIANITVSATSPSAKRNVGVVDETGGGTAAFSNVSLSGIQLSDTALKPFYANVPAESYALTNWTLDGKPVAVRAD
jgi:hypothetical protein